MKSLLNKKGSYTVFITMVFAAVMIMVWAVIWASGQQQISSMTENFGRLWGRSILAEFDINLKERYGLFGYYGNEFLVEEKLDFYADYTFGPKDYISCGPAECSLEGYSLTEKENIKKQIKEIISYGISPEPIFAVQEPQVSVRYINSQWIIEELPSGGNQTGIGAYALAEKLKGGISFSSFAGKVAEDIYVFRFFKDYMDDRELGDTYFNNEVEYILSGKLDDDKAKEKVYNSLIVIRNALNLAYLYSSEEKRNAVLTAAEVIAPGPSALAVQLVIMETWALMEARNDLKLLYNEKPVPIMKSDRTWALSLENVMGTIEPDGTAALTEGTQSEKTDYISPVSEEGIFYTDYLKILISALPEDIKILRIMDLIQINMKYLYCDYFVLADYYTGLDFSLEVNGRTYEFKEMYQK